MSQRIDHQYHEINGTRLHVAVSKPTTEHVKPRAQVLCLHGFPEGWMHWRPLMRCMPDVAFYAPDLRGYPRSELVQNGHDVFTLTEDIDQLIDALGLEQPIMLSHDWGGALGWIYAHRYAQRISQLMVVNCTHPRTLVRAVLSFDDWQTLRIPWVPPFQVPYLPERLLSTRIGRKLLELSFTLREGTQGKMDRDLVREIVARFDHTQALYGAIQYYRDVVRTILHKSQRQRLEAIYSQPIQVPVTLVWGMEDGALSDKVAQKSYLDAGCPVDWRPLYGIGHFVDLEAPQLLAQELDRIIKQAPEKTTQAEALRTQTAAHTKTPAQAKRLTAANE